MCAVPGNLYIVLSLCVNRVPSSLVPLILLQRAPIKVPFVTTFSLVSSPLAGPVHVWLWVTPFPQLLLLSNNRQTAFAKTELGSGCCDRRCSWYSRSAEY